MIFRTRLTIEHLHIRKSPFCMGPFHASAMRVCMYWHVPLSTVSSTMAAKVKEWISVPAYILIPARTCDGVRVPDAVQGQDTGYSHSTV